MSKQKGLAALTGLPKTIYTFILEAREELKKVAWPNRSTTIRYTIIVIVISLVVGLIIGGIDLLFQRLLELVI